MGIEQLKKLPHLIKARAHAANRLSQGLKGLRGLKTPVIGTDCTHVFYVYPLMLDVDLIEINRIKVVDALVAEGVPGVSNGYINLHLLPMYQKKIAYGSKGFPWAIDGVRESSVSYAKGICPIAETMQDKSMFSLQLCMHNFIDDEVDLVIKAFEKIWENLPTLR